MRKHLLFFTAILLAASGTFAQAPEKAPKNNTIASHISLGPVASLGHSWVSNIQGNRDFKFSPALGIGLVYSRNEHWGFGSQLLVSHEGYKQELKMSNNEVLDVTVNPVYLRLPLQAIYFFGNYGDRIRPKVYAGPSFAVRVDETRYYSDEQLRPAEGTPAAADQFRRCDAGLTAGLGANVRINKATWLNLDAGYYHGLIDVMPPLIGQDRNAFNSNNNLRLNVGLMWGL